MVFETESGPDTRPPTITSRLPAPDTAGVAPTATASASFSEPMAAASITTSTVQLRDPDGNLVPAAVTYDNGARAATLDPNGELAGATRYTVTVKGGASGVKDVAGNPLAADASWSFTTAVPPGPGPTRVPAAPSLVIAKASNPFTRYYAEILRAEGLNAFKVTDIANVTPAVLANYDAAILGDMALTAAQVSTLTTWVNGGGDLIAMRPDKQLAGLLGLTDQGTTLGNAYLRVDTSQAPGAGIESATMQYHGAADRYALAGATAVASLYSNASTATTAPGGDRCAASARTAGVRRRSPTTSRARSSSPARATRPGSARTATARRRSGPTTCSSAP